jgi:hypothetical protein
MAKTAEYKGQHDYAVVDGKRFLKTDVVEVTDKQAKLIAELQGDPSADDFEVKTVPSQPKSDD